MHRVHVIDSHTGGEPTRTVISGGPDPGHSSMAARLDTFRTLHDQCRSAILNEPRDSDAMVGALLCEPIDSSCAAGVIYFKNVGYLGMCGHGTVGVAATLAYPGRISAGTDGAPIDHIELFSAPRNAANHSRNFVLCVADRAPREGEVWRQESIINTVFEGSVHVRGGLVYPRIKSSAFISADSSLILQEPDPFRWGIRK